MKMRLPILLASILLSGIQASIVNANVVDPDLMNWETVIDPTIDFVNKAGDDVTRYMPEGFVLVNSSGEDYIDTKSGLSTIRQSYLGNGKQTGYVTLKKNSTVWFQNVTIGKAKKSFMSDFKKEGTTWIHGEGATMYFGGGGGNPTVYSSIAGAGDNYVGNTSINILGGTFHNTIFGGKQGQTGDTVINISGGNIYHDIVGGNIGDSDENENDKEIILTGNTYVTMTGGKVDGTKMAGIAIYGGSGYGTKWGGSVITGDTHVTVGGAAEATAIAGGSRGAGLIQGNTNVIIEGDAKAYGVLGGAAGHDVSKAEERVKDGTITVQGNTNILIQGNARIEGSSVSAGYSGVVGGNFNGNSIGGTTNITIAGGSVNAPIIGGNMGCGVGSVGGANIVISGGIIDATGTWKQGSLTVHKGIYGGNMALGMYDTFSTTIETIELQKDENGQLVLDNEGKPIPVVGSEIIKTEIKASGHHVVNNSTSIDLSGGDIMANIYGGGYARGGDATKTGTSIVNGITTIKVGGSANITGNIYGGGYADQYGVSSIKGNTNIVISGGTITGNIYAGGSSFNNGVSTVDGDAIVTINGGNITGTINGSRETVKGKSILNWNTKGSSAGINDFTQLIVKENSSLTITGSSTAGLVDVEKGASLIVDNAELISSKNGKDWFYLKQDASFTVKGEKAKWSHAYLAGLNEGSLFVMEGGAVANVDYLAFGGTAQLTGISHEKKTVLNLVGTQNMDSTFGGNQSAQTTFNINAFAQVNAQAGLAIGHRSDAKTSKDATLNVAKDGELNVTGNLRIGAGRTSNSDQTSGNGVLNIAQGAKVSADALVVGTGTNSYTGQVASGIINNQGSLIVNGDVVLGAGALLTNTGSISASNINLQEGATLISGSITGSGDITGTNDVSGVYTFDSGISGTVSIDNGAKVTLGTILSGQNSENVWKMTHEQAKQIVAEGWNKTANTSDQNYVYTIGNYASLGSASIANNENIIAGKGGSIEVSSIDAAGSVTSAGGEVTLKNTIESATLGSFNDGTGLNTEAQVRVDINASESVIVAKNTNLNTVVGEKTVLGSSDSIEAKTLTVSSDGSGKATAVVNNGALKMDTMLMTGSNVEVVNNGTITAELTVSSGAILSGSGTFSSVVVEKESKLVVGNSPGVQVYDNLTSKGMVVFSFAGANAATVDGASGWSSHSYSNIVGSDNGTFVLDNTTAFTLEFSQEWLVSIGLNNSEEHTFVLASGFEKITGFDKEALLSNTTFVIVDREGEKVGETSFTGTSYAVEGGKLTLTTNVQGIPEPSAVSLSLLALAGLMFRRRRVV